MKIATFIKRNFIKITVESLLMLLLFISFFSIEFSIESLKNDGKSVNYVGMIRGKTQLLVKQELLNNPNQKMIEELDNIIYQLKKHSDGVHFALHEEPKLQESLYTVEQKWIELKGEIYKYRDGADLKRLYDLSNEYYELADKLVFETQTYVESKVDKSASLRNRLLLSVILILIFNIHQFISKIYVQDKNLKLSSIAFIDSLTELPNRSLCNAVINEYNAMKILPNLACVYMDLNNLKMINDLMGHDVGDKLIHNFGSILKEASEPYGFACRNGGDEFVAIFENCTQKNINDYINYLYEKTEIHNSKEDFKISFAIGVAYSNEIMTNKINDILTLADKRMYENKAEYKKKKLQEELSSNKVI